MKGGGAVVKARGGLMKPVVIAASMRKALWRTALTATGGLRVAGELPAGPCVLVANHASHADTAALVAALPARRRPVFAAASDYWYDRPVRRIACRALVSTIPVRRTGGGRADLARAAELLAAGRDVIVYPEGSRSRDGSIAPFHSGAAHLADAAGVPLVPVGIQGTRGLLPAHGRLHRTTVSVHIGAPTDDLADARAAVALLTNAPAPPKRTDSLVRQRVAAFAASWLGLLAVAVWAFGEALIWPLIPEFALVILVLASPRSAVRLALVAAAASVLGGAVMYGLAAHGASLPAPLTTARMHTTTDQLVADRGAAAMQGQPMSGIPYKVFGAAAGRAHVGVLDFAAASAASRGLRILIVGVLIGLAGVVLRRWRRFYPAAIAGFVFVFSAGLTAVVLSWS
jgi:1-acyl-sn-glycerol-3-phosphate acyltransferase